MTGSHEVTGSIPVGSTTYLPQKHDHAPAAELGELSGVVGILLFEDDQIEGFGPPIRMRPAFEFRVGCLCLRERLEMALPAAPMEAMVREELRPLLRATLQGGEEPQSRAHWIALNARAHGAVDAFRAFLATHAEGAGSLRSEGALLAAWGTREQVEDALRSPATGDEVAVEGIRLHRFSWDLLRSNDSAIDQDALEFRKGRSFVARGFGVSAASQGGGAFELDFLRPSDAGLPPYLQIAGAERVLIAPGVELKPGVVLDAEQGAIVLAPGSRIGANATLVGPCYVGPDSVVNPGAKLREGSSIGRMCKVGGEIEESIFLDFSNKQHDGFLGHALVGSWVNLGADTNASDLKNNYGTVRVDFGHGPVDSGERFVGPVFGDHAKTGINTMLTTGSMVGVSANVFGAGFPPRSIADFAWGGADGFASYDIERALETARVVMERRSVVFLPEHETLLRQLHARSCS